MKLVEELHLTEEDLLTDARVCLKHQNIPSIFILKYLLQHKPLSLHNLELLTGLYSKVPPVAHQSDFDCSSALCLGPLATAFMSPVGSYPLPLRSVSERNTSGASLSPYSRQTFVDSKPPSAIVEIPDMPLSSSIKPNP